ncbi:MAG: hypothetical protein AAF318_00900 [Pseudomonadota bacterium]
MIVTGFGPFPGVPENPSGRLAELVDAAALPGVAVRVLPTLWDTSGVGDVPRGETVLLFGVATSARRVRYEALAHGRDAPLPDHAGARPSSGGIARYSQLPVAALVARAQRAGFDVVESRSPGAYVCNATYRAVLTRAPHSLFVHIPMPGRGETAMARLLAHALWLTAELAAIRPCGVGRARLPASAPSYR